MAPIMGLREMGWNLSATGLQQVTGNGSVNDMKSIERKALDLDLREISEGSFPEDLNKGRLDSIPGKIVVQIQKVRNVSAPKANEESKGAPRMLKLSITDGISVCQAIEIESIPSLSINTAPGTKLYLKGTDLPMVHGIILLKPSQVDVLGGRVPSMVEKWELGRTLAKHSRGRIGEEGGPPPWIPFGQKILRGNTQDRNFKSLESSKDKENRENAEFDAQRKDAIAEAARGGGTKKIFGGGNKSLLDHNVQQIVDYGFTPDQAEHALRSSRNSVAGALRTLQRGEDWQRTEVGPRDRERPKVAETKGKEVDEPRPERRERRKRNDRVDRDEEGGAAPKPSAKVSLFDFLEDKLPVQNEKESEPNIYSGGHSGTDRKPSESHRGIRSDRGGFSQGRGARGAQPRGRGGNSWPSRDKERGGHNSVNPREERYDRNRQNHSDRQVQAPLYQQKPPRFQNQHRHQQQQLQHQQHQQQHQQQHHQQHQQQHQQSEITLTQQTWSPAFNDMNSASLHWNSQTQGTSARAKPRENEFPNGRGNLSSGNYDTRNRPPRPFGNGFDTDKSQGRALSAGISHGFKSQNVEELSAKLNTQHISNNAYQKPPVLMSNNSSVFSVDFGYKEPAVNSSFGGMYDSFGIGSKSQSSQYIQDSKPWVWHKGDKCMAKYWEDSMYYNAEVTGVSQSTCVVRFLEYGNHEEVLQDDCIPFSEDGLGVGLGAAPSSDGFCHSSASNPQQHQNFSQSYLSGGVDFCPSGSRSFIDPAGESGCGNRDHHNYGRSQHKAYLPTGQRK